MKRQKGQSVVEFALVIPLFLLLILGMIYGGFAYADYLQYSTAVREAARDIALQQADTSEALAAKRQALVTRLNNSNGLNYAQPLTKLYTPTFSAELQPQGDPQFVVVGVNLKLAYNVSVLPKKLGPLQCAMPLEKVPAANTGGEQSQGEQN